MHYLQFIVACSFACLLSVVNSNVIWRATSKPNAGQVIDSFVSGNPLSGVDASKANKQTFTSSSMATDRNMANKKIISFSQKLKKGPFLNNNTISVTESLHFPKTKQNSTFSKDKSSESKNCTGGHKKCYTEKRNTTDTKLESVAFIYRVHARLTRSKDAVWATMSLTFICVVLVLAVAQSKMWKHYHGTNMHPPPLPNFNERVPFKDVLEHKMKSLRSIIIRQKHKKKDKRPTDIDEFEHLLSTDYELQE